MNLTEATALINCDRLKASAPQTWFDLGCGSGLFTQALHGLLPEGSLIYAIDQEPAKFNSQEIKFTQLDFVTDPLPDVSVHGMLMANSLHYVKDKLQFLGKLKKQLLSNGIFLLVEYDMETANRWVPYPISFKLSKKLFQEIGFENVYRINDRPSRFNNGSIYAAIFYNL